MTRINKFNITFCTKSTKTMKKAGENEVPQVSPWTQFGAVMLVSYMSMFQFSPVAITKRNKNDCPKSLKLWYSSITFPSLREPKKKTANIENMNSTSTKSKKTLASADTDKVIVCIKACKPSFLLANLTILVTLMTLIIRASYGPKLNESDISFIVNDIMMSATDEITMNASNLFERVSKYLNA